MCVLKRLSLCDHKPLEKFLKGKRENSMLYSWSIDPSSYKLHLQYIKGIKSVLADCLSILVGANLTNCYYKPKRPEIWMHPIRDLPLLRTYTMPETEFADSISIYRLEDQNMTELKEISTLQHQDAHSKCIINSMYIPSVNEKFLKYDTYYTNWSKMVTII